MQLNYYLEVLQKYAVFDGRARRAEFWWFALISFIVSIVLGIVDNILGTGGILGLIYYVGVLLPSIGVAIRRLHDTDRSGWWLLIGFIPLIGALVLIYFYAQDGKPEPNQYGPSPKYNQLMAPPPM